MEGAEEPPRYPQVSGVLQLLSPVYQGFLKDSETTQRSSQERGQMGLGTSRERGLRKDPGSHHKRTSPCSARSEQTIRSGSRCIELCHGSCPNATGREERVTSSGVHLQDHEQCPEELRRIWKRTLGAPRNVQSLETPSETSKAQGHRPHRSRQPPLLEESRKSQLKSGAMARRTHGIRLRIATHRWNKERSGR